MAKKAKQGTFISNGLDSATNAARYTHEWEQKYLQNNAYVAKDNMPKSWARHKDITEYQKIRKNDAEEAVNNSAAETYLRSLAREAANNQIKSAAERVEERNPLSLREIAAKVAAQAVRQSANTSAGNDLMQAPEFYMEQISRRNAERAKKPTVQTSQVTSVKNPMQEKFDSIERFQKANGISKIPQSMTTLNPVDRRMQLAHEMAVAKAYGQQNNIQQPTERIQEAPERMRGLMNYIGRKSDPEAVKAKEAGSKSWNAPEKQEIINIGDNAYQYMSQDEKDYSNYLAGMYGEDARKEYMDSLTPELNKRMTEVNVRTAREYAKEHPVAGHLKAIGQSLAFGPAAIVKDVVDLATGNTPDQNDFAHQALHTINAGREGAQETIDQSIDEQFGKDTMAGTALKRLAKNVPNAIENTARNFTFGSAGIAMMALSAAGQTYSNEIQKGHGDFKALAKSLADGLTEAGTEAISFGKWEDLAKVPAGNWAELGRNLLIMGGTEYGEESIGQGIDNLTDILINTGDSDAIRRYDELKNNGMNDQEAVGTVLKESVMDMHQAGLDGFISGVMMGAAAQGNAYAQNRTYQQIYQNYLKETGKNQEFFKAAEDYQEMIDSVDPKAPAAQDIIQKMQEQKEKVENGEDLTDEEKGKLIDEIMQYMRSPMSYVNEESEVTAPETQETPQETAQRTQETPAQKLAREIAENKQRATQEARQAEKTIPAANVLTDEALEKEENRQEAQKAAAKEEEDLMTQQFTSLSEEGRAAAMELWNQEYQRAEETGSGMRYNLPEFVRAFNTVYDYASHEDSGKVERGMDVLAPAYNLLDEEGFRKAYAAGVHALNDRETNILDSMQKVEQVSERKGSVINLTEDQTNQLNKIGEFMGKTTGLRFIVTDVKGSRVNGGYIRSAGAIVLNMNSKDAIGTLGHELSHYIQDYAPTDAEMFKTFVVSKMIENGSVEGKNGQKVTFEDLIERKAKAYKGQNLTRDELIDEVVADASTEFLKDENSIRELCQENKSLGEKILDFISDMISAIKSVMNNGSITRDEARLLQKNMDTYEQARQMYVKALKKASDNYKSGTEYKGAQESLNASAEEVAGKVFGEEQAAVKFSKEQVENDPEYTEEEKKQIFDFHEEIDNYIHKRLKPQNSVVVTKNTAELYRGIGLKDLPICIAQTHLYQIMHEKTEKNKHFHGLNEWEVANAPGLLAHPAMIIDAFTRSDSIVVISDKTDSDNNPIVIALRPNGEGMIQLQYVDSNFMTSMYGKEDGARFIKKIDAKDVLYIDQKKSRDLASRLRLQLPSSLTSLSSNTILRQSKNIVNIKDKDSNGNALSNNQKVFFRDSKITDERGRLQVLYHQTANDFTVFDKKHPGAGSTDSETPTGIFMKNTDDNIGLAGSRQMKLYANVTNPLEFRNRQEMKKFWEKNIDGYKEAADRIDEIDNKWLPISDKAEAEWDAAYAKASKATPENEAEMDRILDELTEKSDKIIEDWKNEADQARREAKALIDDYIAKSDYDGMIIENDEGSFGRRIKTYIAFEPNQVKDTENKNPTSKPDIRLQLDDVDEEFDVALYKAENDSLRSLNDALQQQITLARGKAVAHADISKVVNSVLSEYESSYRKSTLFQNIVHIYNYLNAGHDPNADTITETMTRLGKAILRESRIKDDTMVKQYADLKKHLKTTAVSLAEKDRPDLDRVGGYQLFVRRNFGKLKITDKGTPVDTIYQELNEQYPDMFPEDITSQADRLIQMSEVAESIKPMYSDRFSNADIDELAVVVGQKLLEPYLNAQTAGEAAIEANQVYRERLRAFKNDLREKNQAAIRKVKEESREKIAELRKQYNEAKVADRQAIKEKMDNLRNEKNQKLRAKQERVSQRIQAIKDNNEAAKIRDRVTKNINKMRKTLAEPTDQNHVPEVLRAPVANILSLIDTSSAAIYYKGGVGDMFTYQADAKGKLHKVKVDIDGNVIPGDKSQRTVAWLQAKAFFEQVANSGNMIENEDGTVTYVDLDPSMNFNLNELQRIVEESKKAEEGYKKLDEMNLYELQNVEKVVNALKSMVQYANALRYNEHFKHVDEAADEALRELKPMEDKRIYDGFKGAVQNFAQYEMLDSYSFFSGLGKATTSVYQELRDGLNRKTRNTQQAAGYMQELLKKNSMSYKDIKELRATHGAFSHMQKFQCNGGEIELTKAQIMSLYLLNKRKQAVGHIYDEKGHALRNGGIESGTQIVSVKKEKGEKNGMFDHGLEVRRGKVVTATKNNVEEIINTLTDKEKRIADGIGEFFNTVSAEWGNEVSMELYGYKKFGDPNYFPIYTDKNYIATTTDTLERTQEKMLKNMSAAQKTVKHAHTPIIIEDIFKVYFRHCDEMSSYNAYVIPLSDFQKFYNYRHAETFDENGERIDPEKMVGGVKQEIVRAFGTPAQTYIEDFLRDVNGARPGVPSDPMDKLLANMKTAAVGANLRVALQQPTAIARAMTEMNPKYLAKGMAHLKVSKEEWNRCKEYAPIAAWKEWGGVGVGTARSMESIIMGDSTLAQDFRNALDRDPEGLAAIKSKSMILAEMGDELTWKRIWMACLAETDDLHKNLNKGSVAYYRQAGKRFSEIIDRTQVVDSPFNRTALMKKHGAMSLYTAFMAEPSKTYNMLYRAVRDVKLDKAGAKKRMAQAVAVFVINAALTASMQAVGDAIRRRDRERDKNFGERWLEALPGDFIDSVNPMSIVPILQDAINALSGQTIARADMNGFADLYKACQETVKFAEGSSKYTAYGLFNSFMKPLSTITGIPAYALTRDGGAVVDNLMELFHATGAEDAKASVLYAKDTGAGLQMFVPSAMSAYIHRDQERGDRLINELMTYNGSKVASKAKAWLKTQPDIIQAAEAKRTGDFENYEKIVQNYVDLGINRNWVIGAISGVKDPEAGDEDDLSTLDRMAQFFGRVGKTSIGSYEEQEPAEEKDLNLYSGKDVAAAVGGYSEKEIASAQSVVDQMAADYRKTGKTNADAKAKIKEAIKAKYQQEFKQMDLTGRRTMINALKKLSIGSMKIFVEDDFKGNKSGQWLYEAKKKK